MVNDALVKELVGQFVERGYKWQIGGKLKPPTVDDMKKILDKADSMMQDGMQMEIARLVLVKTGQHLDVYMFVGDYHESKPQT